MKKLNTLLFMLIALTLFGMEALAQQVPQGFNFQAVAAGTDGLPLADQEISVQIEIVKGTEEGDVVYTETHTVNTNAVGLFQLTIGQGTASEGNTFSSVNWGSDNFFVGLAVDLTNTGNFVSLGKTKLLSVPYALLAQDVVNGTGASAITEYEIDVSTGDTAFTVIAIGDEGGLINPAIIGYANTTGFNIGVDGIGESLEGNETFQYGVRGVALGEGTGLHYGLRGEARAANAWNVGVRGQSIWESTQENYGGWFSGRFSRLRNVGIIADARDVQNFGVQYNTGVVGIASGSGSGDLENGSYNTGVRAEANGNTIGNHAVSAVVFGNAGTDNAGVFAESNVDDGTTEIENMGVKAFAGGPGRNVALYGSAFNGAENYAAWLDGEVVINGDLTVNGAINGEGGGGLITEIDLDAALDTAFTVRISGDEGAVNNSAIIGEASTFGTNVGVEGKAFSQSGSESFQVGTYGEAVGEGSGTHIGVYGWSNTPDRTGGSSYGLFGRAASQGKFNQGARTFVNGAGSGEIIPIGDPAEQDGNFGSFNIGYSTYVEGNLNGNTGVDIEIGGDQGSRINIGAEARVFTTSTAENSGIQAIVNGSSTLNRGFFGYINGDNNNVGMDLTVEGGTDNRGLIVNADIAATFNGAVEINQSDLNIVGDTNDDQAIKINNGGISGGLNPFTDGFQLNHNVAGGTLLEMYQGGNLNVNITGDGNATFAGTVNQSSDLRLKTNVASISNALDNALALRGVSYKWKDETKSQDTQIGLIAQEVEEIYPEFVRTDDEGMKSVNYSQMVAVLIEAVKELNAKIEVLESENSELRAQADDIKTMKAQINQLMTLISGTESTDITPKSADK
ncbi:MAG: tail fiber domain-containing protein [bacterium]|nr:tail fiber domain-containing protein [bacterium]